MNHSFAVIMAGGKGERFWPLSTERRPKQLLAFAGGKPMVVQAVDRLTGVVPAENIVIVTSKSLVQPIREMLGSESPVGILGEPIGKDTAAAIALGAAWVKRRDPDGVFCVLTADHVIGDLPKFCDTLKMGMDACSSNDILITIGIVPTEPSSAYGYIETGEVWKNIGSLDFFHVRRFVEKPDVQTATKYLAENRYFWNSGMFIWSTRSIERAFCKYRHQLASMMNDWAKCPNDDAFQAAIEDDFQKLDKISIDYAVMEKADNIVMCRGVFSWDDVGSWPALEAHLPMDSNSNACLGDVESVASTRNIVVSEGRLTALVGVDNLVVVQSEGVTLVCSKTRAQEIKTLVSALRLQAKHSGLL